MFPRFYQVEGSQQLFSTLAQVTMPEPEAYQSHGQAQRYVRIACVYGPVLSNLVFPGPSQGGPDVVVLVLQPVEPFPLPRSHQVRLGLLGQRQEVAGVLIAERSRLTGLLQ